MRFHAHSARWGAPGEDLADRKKYFAARDKEELAHELTEKLSAWGHSLSDRGIIEKWIKSYRLYFGRHYKNSTAHGTEILKGGKEGELSLVTVNHYRNLIKHILVMTTNQKPTFDVRAINSDSESLQQAKLGNNILDSYMREKRLSRYLKQAAEQSLVFGKGFVKIVWEPSLGRPYTVEERSDESGEPVERVVYEGDVDVSCPSPFDVYVDQSQEDWNKVEHVTIRSFRNKWNLAARYPEQNEKIESLQTKSEIDGRGWTTLQDLDESNDVPVYEFYHKRTDAMPNGRYMLFCNGDTVLYDGPIPYQQLPIFRITPGEIFGTTEGYTDAFDLMAIQEAINVLASTIFSNQNAFGVQSVLVPNGCNISYEQLNESLAIIKYNQQAGEPKPLQLTSTPPEIFKFFEILERTAETLSGVNSVARGNPESSLKSGVALGLVQSMAVQYASGFQQSWAELLEDSGSFILSLLKDFAKTERMVAMAGKGNKGNMTAFTGDKLKNINRVIVELGNPMSRTTAGRVQIADNLLEKGMIKTPQEYVTVMETGNLEPLIEGIEATVSQIRTENEDLMEGKPVKAIVGDAHLLHAQQHLMVVADPELRRKVALGDPTALKIVQETLAHIMEHNELKETQLPIWSAISGEPPMAPPPMPMPEQGAPMPPPPPVDPNAPPPIPMPEMAPLPQGPMPGVPGAM